MKVLDHALPIDCYLFDPHEIKDFYIGVEMVHCHLFKRFIPSTDGVRISDTIRWFPHGNIKLPTPSKDELLRSTIDDLRDTLQSSVKNNIIPPEGTTYRKTLLDLNLILKNQDVHDPHTKPPTPNNFSRAKVQ